jgi:hypothetical protein
MNRQTTHSPSAIEANIVVDFLHDIPELINMLCLATIDHTTLKFLTSPIELGENSLLLIDWP